MTNKTDVSIILFMYKNCKVKFLLPSRTIWDAYSVIELQKLPLALNLQCSSNALFDNMDTYF